MEPIFNIVTEFLDGQEWPYSEIERDIMDSNEAGLRTAFTGQNGQFNCLGLVDESKRMFVFYSFSSARVPEEKLGAMMEFITRANYDMYIGNFELDLSDGELRFKASVDFDDSEATTSIVKGVIFMSVLMMDRYLPGIMRILYSDITPVQAVAEVEDNWQPPDGQVSA